MRHALLRAIASWAGVFLAATATAQTPLTTSFTYQGELASGGASASGAYDLRFRLYDSELGGTQIGATLCRDNVAINGGVFTAALDFGAVFTGEELFLEIEVRPDTGLDCSDSSGYTVLSPRQELTATPYASYALTAGSAATAQTANNALTANNATSLNGQPPTFFTNAANLTSGTLDAGRLPAAAVRTDVPNAFGQSVNTFAGQVGVGTTTPTSLFDVVGYLRTGAGATPDQQQDVQNSFGSGNDLWQSFTAGQNGQLTIVSFNGASGVSRQSRAATLQIYAGEGIGGPLLGSASITFVDAGTGAWVNANILSQIVVVAGERYTLRLTIGGAPIYISASDANSYPGGRTNGPDFRDYMFRTFVLPATRTSMLNIGVNGVGIGTSNPSNLLTIAGNTDVRGSLGVNVAAPAQRLHVAGNVLIGGNGQDNLAFGLDAQNGPRLGIVKKSGFLPMIASAANQPIIFAQSDQPDVFTNIAGATLAERLRIDSAGNVGVNNNLPIQTLDVNGRVRIANGVIQRGNPAINATSDLGLYSLVDGQWMRMVTTNAPFKWFTEPGPDGVGLIARMTLDANGLSVTGTLTKGGGSFKIDHPLDPENKYLYHSFVESPDMMNVYNGNVTTNDQGYATITLPDYFEALNRDFRYQLTVIDEADTDDVFVWAKVVRKINDNRFTVRTSRGGVEVSWQVTGIRKDAWAEKNRIPNTVEKPAVDRGRYLHPEAFGKPASQSVRVTGE
ncbi:MAG: hypothetical protein SFY96_11810 [Planctomycetota bacterium]|nr:hypothetical protein [Planctomycetota bacterium]